MPSDGGRTGATMAALVEDAKWRTSAKGRRYLMATLSDPSGQFIATCFDDNVSQDLEEAARVGGCGLMTVELDRRAGEETPRVTVKRVQPFETLATTTRMAMEIRVTLIDAIAGIDAELASARGARGEVRVIVPTDGGEATLLLGRDFLLEGELAARIEALHGVESVELRPTETRLALVG
jgi:DNA polymerase-3 subunit alpha